MTPKKILLVDDEEPVRAVVGDTLRHDSRYQLMEARNGAEALEKAFQEKPALILLDIRMPGMDGFEVCRRLKSDPRTRDITVIVLTALAQEAYKERGQEVGADGYFTKPFSPSALIAKVEEVLGG
ncbi:MAG: response regulator [Dehalococcoidia bacterium]